MALLKKIAVVLGSVVALSAQPTRAAGPSHHAKHNFVVFGEEDTFASHLVYKVPHHYQVILKILFDEATRRVYLGERKTHPQEQILLLLDPMDLKEIGSARLLSGTLLRLDGNGKKTELARAVRIEKKDFELVYFDELPLSLAPGDR